MILRYVTNLKVAKALFDAAKPKLQNADSMKEVFSGFNLPKELVPVIGAVETTASVFMVLSIFNKRISQIASILTLGVMVGAITNHFKDGQGKKGAQHAIDVFTMSGLSLLDTLVEKKK